MYHVYFTKLFVKLSSLVYNNIRVVSPIWTRCRNYTKNRQSMKNSNSKI